MSPEGMNRLRFLVEHPQAWQITGQSDTSYVSDAQLIRHIGAVLEYWEDRWPHRVKDLGIKAGLLVRSFAPDLAPEGIAQAHRWEFLQRLIDLPKRYNT